MMTTEDYCINRYERMKAARSTWENTWQEVRDLVRPHTSDFQRRESPGLIRTEHIYDGTAVQALEELASGLMSFLTNPADRWFEIRPASRNFNPNDHEAMLWLETVSDIIYEHYCREASGFNGSITENYLDLGGFGTTVLYQDWDVRSNGLHFRAIPLADCWIDENANGRVDTLFRKILMTVRQLDQMFGYIPPKYAKDFDRNQDKELEVVHCVFPRSDRDVSKANAKNMAWASIYLLKEDKQILQESGYTTFPYHVPRWSKIAGEIYGRSPATKCLPDIKMLNRMEYVNIKAVQKAVDPPILVPHDGFILPIKTAPGSINFKEPGTDSWEALEFKGQWPVALEITNQKRDFIRQCFFSDWLRMEKEKIEMTAFEVQDRRDEKLRFLAPMLGRIQAELLNPLIERSYNLLREHDRIPLAPPGLQGASLKVGYVSPAARAQLGAKAIAMGRYIQELIPMAQIDPAILDAIDLDSYAQELAVLRGTSRKILRPPQEIDMIRQARAQQQAMAQMAQIAEPATKSVLNLAKANEAGNIL